MQFMITRHSQKTSWDKFEVQDIAVEKFRKFATEHNVSRGEPFTTEQMA